MTERLPQGHRLHRLDALTSTHMGRQIQVEGITGQLVGLIPLNGRVICALIVGGARCWTDALDGGTEVEIWKEAPGVVQGR